MMLGENVFQSLFNFLEQGKLLFLFLVRTPAYLQLIKEQPLAFLHNDPSTPRTLAKGF